MHLYGGAAAMLDDVMQVQWEVEVYCARVTCGLCLAAGLCPFLSLFQSLFSYTIGEDLTSTNQC